MHVQASRELGAGGSGSEPRSDRPAGTPDAGMSATGRPRDMSMAVSVVAWVSVTSVEPRTPTLLRTLLRERRLTVGACLELLEARARRMGETRFSLSERQLRRWMAGDVASHDGGRPANVRVVEEEFGFSIAELLAATPLNERGRERASAPAPPAELCTAEFVEWVADHSELSYDLAYRLVLDASEHHASRRTPDRHGPDRALLAETVAAYYGHPPGLYEGRVGAATVQLSILSDPDWVGLSIPLGGPAERCRLVDRGEGPRPWLNDAQARRALARLAEAETARTVLVNNPLYRLIDVDLGPGGLDAGFGLSDFAAYALTADLLETELVSLARSGVRDPRVAPTPDRDAWLPSVEAAREYERRICAGGIVCLIAIADRDSYRLLVQERSARVVNVAGALAVIPKAFHQPTIDAFGETALSTTLEREVEEELLGRPDLELLGEDSGRRAAPLHPAIASPPMRWLHEHPDAWRRECTGFGINLVSGNFEFACLAVVEDPAWWATYGHLLQANWEAMRLQRHVSTDSEGLVHLARDRRWSNEALFAFIEGLRRLGELDRAKAPVIAGAGW